MSRYSRREACLESFPLRVAACLFVFGGWINLGGFREFGFGRGVELTQVGKIDFIREVRPILAKNCFACHGQDEAKRAKGFRLDLREAATKSAQERREVDRTGRPRTEQLIFRVTEDD